MPDERVVAKPSAGALRILSAIMPGYQFQSDMSGPERGRAIDAEVRPLVEALEDTTCAECQHEDCRDNRAILAAWRGE